MWTWCVCMRHPAQSLQALCVIRHNSHLAAAAVDRAVQLYGGGTLCDVTPCLMSHCVMSLVCGSHIEQLTRSCGLCRQGPCCYKGCFGNARGGPDMSLLLGHGFCWQPGITAVCMFCVVPCALWPAGHETHNHPIHAPCCKRFLGHRCVVSFEPGSSGLQHIVARHGVECA